MIRFSLRCDAGHTFESWFQSGSAFDKLQAANALSCPVCGGEGVEKAPMAPPVQASRAMARKMPQTGATDATGDPVSTRAMPAGMTDPPPARAMAELRAAIEAKTEDVGRRFATEARAIHDGSAPERAIRGHATADEAHALKAEGIDVLPLPFRDPKLTH